MSAPAARTSSGCTPLTVACVPTGMKAGVRTAPCGGRDLAAARRAVGRDQAEGKRRQVMLTTATEQQAGVAVGIEAIAGLDRMRIGALASTSRPQNAATSMNKVERGRWKLVIITSTARKR